MLQNGTNQQELALYKTIVKIENKTFEYNGKTLSLSNGLKAQAVVFPGRASALYVDVYPCV